LHQNQFICFQNIVFASLATDEQMYEAFRFLFKMRLTKTSNLIEIKVKSEKLPNAVKL